MLEELMPGVWIEAIGSHNNFTEQALVPCEARQSKSVKYKFLGSA